MKNLGPWIKHELGRLLPPTIFYFIAFELLALTQAMMLRQYGITLYMFGAAAFAALVVAKVMLFADMIPIINRFPTRPLIYNVVWKTSIYFVASLGVRYVEHFIHFWRKTDSVDAAHRELIEHIVWPHFWIVQIWLLVLLLVYCSLRELTRAIGKDRVVQMFFGRRGTAIQAVPTAKDH